MLLVAGSCQRKRAVAGAHAANFEEIEGDVLGDARKTARKIGDPRPHVEPLARWAAAAPARPAGRGWMPFKVGRVVIGAHHNRRMLIRD